MSYAHQEIEEISDPKVSASTYKLKRKRSDFTQHAHVYTPFKVYWWNKTKKPPFLYTTTTPYGSTVPWTRPSNTWSCEDSIRNPGYDAKKFGEPADTGSELFMSKVTWLDDVYRNVNGWYNYSSIYNQNYVGPVGVAPWGFSHDGIIPSTATKAPSSDGDFSYWGPIGWNRAAPAKPIFDGAKFLAEARELPSLLHQKLEGLRSIGDWWLAVQYGWVPLLNDIKAMLRFVDRVNEQIDFFVKNAGKPVRRSVRLASTRSSEEVSTYSGTANDSNLTVRLNGRFFPADYSKCKSSCICLKEQDIWFSGAFIFWFSGKIPDRTELARRLLGLQVTPAVVWQLLPWSWLVDWFNNLGTVMANLNTRVADSQVSTYAYVMGHTKRTYTWTGTDGYVTASISKQFDTKVRRRVNPFGGASSPDDLTGRQLSILAALGLQRSGT